MKLVLVSVDDRYQERVYTFAWPPPHGVVWIGRGEESDLVLAHETVALRHAKVWVEGERVFVEDCSQTESGTTVGGVRVSGVDLVDPDDTIQIGAVALTVHDPRVSPLTQHSAR